MPEAELDARYSVLESTVGRYGTPEHWVKINNKLKLLGEEDKRISFWIISGDRQYEYGTLTPQIRAFAEGPLGMRDSGFRRRGAPASTTCPRSRRSPPRC